MRVRRLGTTRLELANRHARRSGASIFGRHCPDIGDGSYLLRVEQKRDMDSNVSLSHCFDGCRSVLRLQAKIPQIERSRMSS